MVAIETGRCVDTSGGVYCVSPQKLEALNQYPDFNNYLVYVFTKVCVPWQCMEVVSWLCGVAAGEDRG